MFVDSLNEWPRALPVYLALPLQHAFCYTFKIRQACSFISFFQDRPVGPSYSNQSGIRTFPNSKWEV